MVGDVIPHTPQYFLSGFRRFTKMTFVRSRRGLFPQSPVAAPAQNEFRRGQSEKIETFGYNFCIVCGIRNAA